MESNETSATAGVAVSVEQFLKNLSESGLLPVDEIKAIAARVPPEQRKDCRPLIQELVQQGKLTKYQAAMLYQSRIKGLVMGNYAVLDKLGQGGMGMVFKAQHRRMERTVALKVLSPSFTQNPSAVQRFQREVRAAAKLSHRNIVAAYDADDAQGVHFLVMEYVEGTDLSQLVKKSGPLPVGQALDCVEQAAHGLLHAHEAGVIHRDIKPANLLLDTKGTVKILDMGLARVESAGNSASPDELTSSGSIMGTCDYMAPEQAVNTHKADHRADIYSLGCTLFSLVTGKVMYRGDTPMEKLMAHQQEPIPPLPGVSEQAQAVYRRMVAKKADERYQSMAEVIAALEPCRAEAPGEKIAARAGRRRTAAVLGDQTQPETARGKLVGAMREDKPVPRRARGRLLGSRFARCLLGSRAGCRRGGRAGDSNTGMASRSRGGPCLHRQSAADRGYPGPRHREKTAFTDRAQRLEHGEKGKGKTDKQPKIPTPPISDTPDPRTSLHGPIGAEKDEQKGQISAVAFSPDGTHIACSTRGGGVKLWNLNRLGDPTRVLTQGIYWCLAFAPDSKSIAAGGFNGDVRTWAVNSGEERATMQSVHLPTFALTFALGDKAIVQGQFASRDPHVQLWDVGSKKGRAWPGKDLPEMIPVLTISPGGKWLACVGKDNRIRLWDTVTGKLIATMEGHKAAPGAVAISPDNSLVASGDADGWIHIWNASTGTEKKALAAHAKGGINALAFSTDSSLLASGGWDAIAHVWDVATGRERATLRGHRNGVTAVAFSPDAKTIATGSRDMTVKLWDIPRGDR